MEHSHSWVHVCVLLGWSLSLSLVPVFLFFLSLSDYQILKYMCCLGGLPLLLVYVCFHSPSLSIKYWSTCAAWMIPVTPSCLHTLVHFYLRCLSNLKVHDLIGWSISLVHICMFSLFLYMFCMPIKSYSKDWWRHLKKSCLHIWQLCKAVLPTLW